jgi:signal peptide peptidase SppA
MSDYRRILSAFYGQVWAIERSKFDEIESVLLARAAGERLSDDEIRARIGQGRRPVFGAYDIEADTMAWAAADGTEPSMAGRQIVAVVGVYGTLTHRASMFTDTSGLASAEAIGARVKAAAADPGVKGIVLDVDSPGGSVYGMQELAAEIRAARAVKPVRGVANARAGSAGYWALAQAEMVYVTPSGEAGSIGVFVQHEDRSEALAKEGVKVTTIAYGKNKALGGPHEPLSDEARADLEKRVAEYGRAFEADVAKGRGVTAAAVRKDFGQGLMFSAAEAVARGLADKIATLDEVVRLTAKAKGPAPAKVAAEAVEVDMRAAALARLRGL